MKLDLLFGKSEQRLKERPDNSLDSCVTDPPYELNFMGRRWDATGIAFSVELWAEVLRVLKPGAHLLAFGATRKQHRMVCAIEDAGFDIRDNLQWLYSSGFPKSHNLDDEFDGYGTALKPAHEQIVLARKPIDQYLTVKANMELWRCGALNIDACRVPGEPWRFGTQVDMRGGNFNTNRPSDGHVLAREVTGGREGRWPANVIHDGSAEVLSYFPDAPGQQGLAVNNDGAKTNTIYGKYKKNVSNTPEPMGDTGSAGRFFYVPKPSQADRNEGTYRNRHTTVKPTQLMQYLVTLITPTGGTVLDPFNGSGSTGKACAIEGFDYLGIDDDKENIETSRLRIQYILDHRDLFGTFRKPKA